jgi:molecular chaperone DnaK
MLVGDARKAISEEAPLERLRSLTSELQQVYHGLGAAEAASGTAGRPGGGAGPDQGPSGGAGDGAADDDVIDAEFTTRE